mmetsp:Transcript_21583/g.59977  ORF Transcript_21583/g.59977 Transcript_21583/m.59977 type:complete len:216 (-) Transcript_21583:93-740(-)
MEWTLAWLCSSGGGVLRGASKRCCVRRGPRDEMGAWAMNKRVFREVGGRGRRSSVLLLITVHHHHAALGVVQGVQQARHILAGLAGLLAKVDGSGEHLHLAARDDEGLVGGLALHQRRQQEVDLVADLLLVLVRAHEEGARELCVLWVLKLEVKRLFEDGVKAWKLLGLHCLAAAGQGDSALDLVHTICLQVELLDVRRRDLHCELGHDDWIEAL